jgi:hypothetical protein
MVVSIVDVLESVAKAGNHACDAARCKWNVWKRLRFRLLVRIHLQCLRLVLLEQMRVRGLGWRARTAVVIIRRRVALWLILRYC